MSQECCAEFFSLDWELVNGKTVKTPGCYNNAYSDTLCVLLNRNSVFADWTKWKGKHESMIL